MALVPLGAVIRQLAESDPDRDFITCAGRTHSRLQVERNSNRMARWLAANGVAFGDYVTIALPNSIEFIELSIACWKVGATPQPLSYRLPQAELDAILDLVKPALLITEVPSIPDSYSDEPLLPDAVSPSWKAPTSGGSTGRPKIIVDGRKGEIDPAADPVYKMPRNGIVGYPGPLYHNAPFNGSLRGLLVGNHVVLMERFDAEGVLALIEQYRISYLFLVPTMMRRIIVLPDEVKAKYDLSTFTTVFSSAAGVPVWLKQAWIDWLGPEGVHELYSGTERIATVEISGTEWLEHQGSVGRLTFGELRIVDPDTREPLPNGEIGLIEERSPQAQRPTYRYLGAESNEREDGWDTLGDMGWIDDDGWVYLSDRRTDMILRGGANIYPAEVEGALESHPAIESSAVIGLPDEDLGAKVHAIVHATGPVTEQELLDHLSTLLVRYKLPQSFEFVDEPLRSDAGKVRRSELRDQRIARS
ncbi:MAG: AMP-binding protein [Acidimicrobiia bacterium]